MTPEHPRERLAALLASGGRGRWVEVEPALLELAERHPDFAPAWFHAGVAAHRLGHLAVAADRLRRAVVLDEGQPAFHYTLGLVAQDQADFAEAVTCFRRAIQLAPGLAQAYNNLGLALQDLDDLAQAETALREALRLKPDYAIARCNLAALLATMNQLPAAEQEARRALQDAPDFLPALLNLARILVRDRRDPEAEPLLRRAVALAPGSRDAHEQLSLLLLRRGEVEAALAVSHALLVRAPNPDVHSARLFHLHYAADLKAETVFAEHVQWAARHAAPQVPAEPVWNNDPDPERRLRVGYLSADFRRHSLAFFLKPLLQAHDRGQMEICCYANVTEPDALTDEFRAMADQWRDIRGLSDEALAACIREDRVDILVDLAGHTAGNRLLALARKPAPVQVTYLGYLGTTAVPGMDYRLTDVEMDPPGLTERFHTERLIRLPGGQWCYAPPEVAPPVNELPCLRGDGFTFASFNTFAKINARVLDAWAAILQRVPDARLLVMTQAGSGTVRLLEAFAVRGIDPSRLLPRENMGFHDYLALHGQVDVVLDTFPYAGGTVTLHALWMGVPVVTLAGDRPFSRSGASILRPLGLDGWVADTVESYVDIAVARAGGKDALARLRGELRDRMRRSSLLDAKGFARGIEQAYRDMWTAWCQDKGLKEDGV